ncbi:MAG: RsmE family RNA methyltransferase [Luteitalea sp.]|nr:RsmE family RNA methyltransferase [Luteitalea sp.]
MNLIILKADEVDPTSLVRLSDRRATHALRVLQIAPGDELRVGLLDGPRGVGVVQSVELEAVTLRCRFDGTPPPRSPVSLLLALPRPKVMRRLWAQIAALGVDRILLTNAARVERQYFDTHLLAPEVYDPLLLEGLEQANDTRCPRVSIHRRFRVLVEDGLDPLFDGAVRLLADPGAGQSVGAILGPETPKGVLLAIGPEGGWNAFERDLLAAHHFEVISIGPRILRTDTACIALLGAVHDRLARVGEWTP